MKLEVGKFYKDHRNDKVLCATFYHQNGFSYYTLVDANNLKIETLRADIMALQLFREWQEPGQLESNSLKLEQQIDELSNRMAKLEASQAPSNNKRVVEVDRLIEKINQRIDDSIELIKKSSGISEENFYKGHRAALLEIKEYLEIFKIGGSNVK